LIIVKKLINFRASLIFFVIFANGISAQEFRGTIYSAMNTIPHRDNSLNLYDFGKNSAWLLQDEKEDWLKISPSFSNTSGDYKRKYDFGERHLYNLNFKGVKLLSSGTFLGEAGYNYEDRKEVYRSLKYDTYDGEAFFSTDSVSGSFSYRGPSMGFTYSFELLPDFYLGPSLKYSVMSGLKTIYSKAKTIFRRVETGLGVAYKFNPSFIAGTTIELGDSQEKIDSRSDDSQPVEIFNYRGETYFISDRSNIVAQKVKKQNLRLGAQIFLSAGRKFQFAAKGDVRKKKTRILIPRANIQNNEDGYADTWGYDIAFQSRYYHSENLSYGAFFDYIKDESRSFISNGSLLIWDWNTGMLKAGSGFSYYFKEINLKLAGELEYGRLIADSSKYIDLRANNIKSDNYLAKLNVEYTFSDDLILSAGFDAGYYGTDLISGGRNTISNDIRAGLCKIWKDLQASLGIDYSIRSPHSGRIRRTIFTFIELKYSSF